MRYPKPTFITNEIYHIYNRGVEKREIFLETADYLRMIHNLYELNDKNATLNSEYHPKRNPGIEIYTENRAKESLVEILAFVLMPNHYHLIVREKEEGGVVRFMQKFGVGYAMYFNKIYDRVGPLFQGRFKATHVKTEEYLRNLVGYVHTNPVELIDNYQNRTSTTIDQLKKYRWSSFSDYMGISNFPAVTSRGFILELMGGDRGVETSAESWIVHRRDKKATVPEIAGDRRR